MRWNFHPELCMGKDFEGRSCGVCQGTVLTFAQRHQGKPGEISGHPVK